VVYKPEEMAIIWTIRKTCESQVHNWQFLLNK
jgi:hypothetical protein